ncbi:hypothetical protein HZS_6199, partial [Henneguya salminicola]
MPLTKEEKKKIVEMVIERGLDLTEAASRLSIHRGSAENCIDKYKKLGNSYLEETSKKDADYTLRKDTILKIEEINESYSVKSNKEISRIMKEKYGLNVSYVSVGLALRKLRITRKRLAFDPAKDKDREIVRQRRLHAFHFYKFAPMDRTKVIFIEESGFASYPWNFNNPQIKHLGLDIKSMRLKKEILKLIIAMNSEKIVHFNILKQYDDILSIFPLFISELTNILDTNTEQKNCWFILGNELSTIRNSISDQIFKSKHFFKELPPYSHKFNPIDEAFEQIKISMKCSMKTNHTWEPFKESIQREVLKISEQEICNYYYKALAELDPYLEL